MVESYWKQSHSQGVGLCRQVNCPPHPSHISVSVVSLWCRRKFYSYQFRIIVTHLNSFKKNPPVASTSLGSSVNTLFELDGQPTNHDDDNRLNYRLGFSTGHRSSNCVNLSSVSTYIQSPASKGLKPETVAPTCSSQK